MDNWPGGGHLTQCQSIHWPKKPHFLEMWGQKDELTEDSVDVQPQVCNLPWFLAWTTNQWPVLWSYSQIIASIVVADKGFAQIFQGHTSMALHLTPALQASCLPLPHCPEIRYITRPNGNSHMNNSEVSGINTPWVQANFNQRDRGVNRSVLIFSFPYYLA